MNTYSKNNRGFSVGGLISVVALAAVILFSVISIKVRTVKGNEIGVEETWQDGVINTPLQPGTYWWLFGFNKEVYTYTTSGQVFVMNDKPSGANGEPFAEGRQVDPLIANSLDNQKVTFHTTLTWHIDPSHVVQLHKNYRDNIEERLIRPEEVNEVGIRATLQNAIDLYSGPKLNELRSTVTSELRSSTGKLAQNGIVVDRFVIEKPELNPEYEKLIEQRQLAIATESQAKEQQKANLALAAAQQAQSQIALNKAVVEADAAKQVSIKQQEATAQQSIIQTNANAANTVTQQEAEAKKVVIAAKAEAERNIAISEAQKQAEINRSVGIEAVGKATAEANKLLLASYSVPGSDLYTRIQVASSLATSFSGVKGYLPSNVTYNTVAENFDKGVSLLVGPATAAPEAVK